MNAPDRLADLRVNPDWAKLPLFDRKGWRTMKFGDFADSINERVEPADAADEPYVGLDDLDSGDLHIRRWGKGSDVIGTKLRFRKGDIIFGRRRAYQRKLAVAEFDGICSAHAMVVRAKPDVVLPAFLPFLMMSDRFMKRAVEISVGSLSPTINWTTLKLEEFDLPPLEQQERTERVLSCLEETIRSTVSATSTLDDGRRNFFDEALRTGVKNEPQSLRQLGDALVAIIAGKSPKASNKPATVSEFGVLKVSAVGDGMYVEEENKALLAQSDFDAAFEVKPGMILVTRANALLSGVGRACQVTRTRPGLMLCDKTLQLVPDESRIDPHFLLHGLRRDPYRGYVENAANGTGAKNISQEKLRNAPFWIPDLKRQRDVATKMEALTSALESTSKQLSRLTELRTTLLNAIFP